MISSSFNTQNNTFNVVLDNGAKVSGTFKVIVVRSNHLCALNFQVNCDKHEPPADSGLEQSINFIAVKQEIGRKLSEYALSRTRFDIFPNMEEHDSENNDESKKK